MNSNTKKILLSIGFIAVLGIYVVYERANTKSSNPIAINNQQSSQNFPAVTGTPGQNTTQGLTYKDGTYTGNSVDAVYGLVQVQAVINGGKLTDIKFLNFPQDRQHSVQVSNFSLPQLKSEAIQAQNSNVDVVSGATATSEAFMQSLASALSFVGEFW